MSWYPVGSGNKHSTSGTAAAQVLFNIFIKGLYDGPECNKLGEASAILNCRGLIQKESWGRKSNLTEFSKEKQKVCCLRKANPLDSWCLSSSYTGESMEVVVDLQMNLDDPCTQAANEGKDILRHLWRSMVSISKMLWSVCLYLVLVRPHLEYCN